MKQAYGQLDILREFVALLHRHHIPFLLSGSFAVSYWGYPRATHDIDFVLELSTDQNNTVLVEALTSLSKAYVQDTEQIHETPLTFYSLYHSPTSTKVDLWFNAASDFQREWKRRRETSFQGIALTFVSAEDLILKKLEWCKEVMSERHMRDCVGMWKVQKGKLDEKYLFAQAKKLGVEKLLKEVIETKEY